MAVLNVRRLLEAWGVAVLAVALLAGCDSGGSLTDSGFDTGRNPPTIDDRNLSAIAGPSDPSKLEVITRIPRVTYGEVAEGDFIVDGEVTQTARERLLFPGVTDAEVHAVAEGLGFFTTLHTPDEGLGPVANQARCLGCHLASTDAVDPQLAQHNTQLSRASRSTPTDFRVVRFNPETGGGVTPGASAVVAHDESALIDLPIPNPPVKPGVTNAFTIYGDFSPAGGTFDPLTAFGGTVQHVRPSIPACVPDPVPPISIDPLLQGGVDPNTGLSALGLRRTSGERAGPPYIGRGLMEAIYQFDIVLTSLEDPSDQANHNSSLDLPTDFPECLGDCISGRHNENSPTGQFVGADDVVRMGRFGLRAAGPTLLQFVTGGAQGELGFTNEFNLTELNNNANVGRPGCKDPTPEPELREEAILSCRNLIRMSAPPEFGAPLLSILASEDPQAARADPEEVSVQRGARLFGVDLTAFANRTIAGKGNAGRDDGLDPHAINQADRMLNCVGCHTPIHATGQSPSPVGNDLLSNKWAHVFSDILIHDMGEVRAERVAQSPRYPYSSDINPGDRVCQLPGGGTVPSFDISRNLADDTLPTQGIASGREWRTYPLWGMGKTGTPFLHDARVFLSNFTVNRTPASTVFTHGGDADLGTPPVTNERRCIETLDSAINAAIELHDLPAPDDDFTPRNPPTNPTQLGSIIAPHGCPLPREQFSSGADIGRPIPADQGGQARIDEIVYSEGANGICPPYLTLDPSGAIQQPAAIQTLANNRSEARESIRRFRRLSPRDQQAVIDFLKRL